MRSWLPSLILLPLALASLPKPDANGKYTIQSTGIRAQFIPYSAAITNLFVSDRSGTERDIVLGYDTAAEYENDPNHPDYGAIPGRYVNRIANHTYEMDGVRYTTEANDGNGTLHSGLNGWSRRMWNVTAATNTSITFSMIDRSNSSMGFPGLVLANVTYSVAPYTWNVKIRAVSKTHITPIMATNHAYWNLDAFADPDTDLVLNHTLSLPYGTKRLGIDKDTQATGEILDVEEGDVNDFWSKPKQIGTNSGDAAWVGNCGTGSGCSGYNNQILIVRNGTDMKAPVASLSSAYTGIKWDLYSDQVGTVLYSCFWMGGLNQMKSTQGGPATNGFVQSNGCVCVEPHDMQDGINHPEWGRDKYQFFGPESRPYENNIMFKFGTI